MENNQINQEDDEDRRGKKKYTIKVVIITSIICIVLFIAFVLLSRNSNSKYNESYISNLTNTSIVQGYLVGYQQSHEAMMNMINQSVNTCQLIRANVSGRMIELVPTTCLNNTRT